jgi:hypothetical protein
VTTDPAVFTSEVVSGVTQSDLRLPESPHGCPVLVEARRTAQLGRVLLRTLHRLCRSSRSCERCGLSGDGLCPALERLHSQIHTTIEEIFEQWSS